MTSTVLRVQGGGTISLNVHHWRSEPDEHERALLTRLADPVLDVGCGPGRIATELAAAGRVALGIDPAPAAAGEAARRGAPVLRRSVFAPLPGEGRWATTLLLDGNVGIGGDPVRLLRRCRELLRPGGHVVAEVAPPGVATEGLTVRVESGTAAGPWFAWAVVGADDWAHIAAEASLRPDGIETSATRWFGTAVRG